MRRTILILFVISFLTANGQEKKPDPTTFDYSKADSIALHFPKKPYKYYTELAGPLTENLKTEHEKFRVLFRWITDNIQYNYGNRTDDADKAVKSKKAVCIGYSTLLKEMCNSVGIDCEIIIGYSKRTIEDINKKLKKTDHAWNAVKLYDKWYLVDVTWATSYYDERKRKIIKEYDELYYLTPPEIFVKKHLPEDKKWQLLDKPMKKSEFIRTPIYYEGFFETNISSIEPKNGIIKMKLKDTLEIKYTTSTELKKAVMELGTKQFIYNPTIQQKDNYYFTKQKFERPGTYKLTLFLNGQGIAVYKLQLKE